MSTPRTASAAMLCAGMVLVVLGCFVNWKAGAGWRQDFAAPYIMGRMTLDGTSAYDAAARQTAYRRYAGTDAPGYMFYPPSSGLAFLPLLALPYRAAEAAWFALTSAVLLWGVWLLTVTFAPAWKPGPRALVMGLAMCSSSVRWAMQLAQASPLATGLLGIFLYALARNRRGTAYACAGYVLCLKVTLGLPFLGLALMQRRFRMALGLLAFCLLANVVGAAGMGGRPAVDGYRRQMARFEMRGTVNSWDPRDPAGMYRTDWPYVLNALSPHPARSRAIGLVLTALLAMLLWREARRCGPYFRETGVLGMFSGPITCLSLLAVYHHQYDINLLLAPLVVALCMGRETGGWRRWSLFAVPVVVFAGLWPEARARVWVGRLFGAGAAPLLHSIFWLAVLVAFIGSLAALRRYVARLGAEPPVALATGTPAPAPRESPGVSAAP